MASSLRKFLRAPLYREVLYLDDGHILKCFAVNISEEGILLTLLPHVPQINFIPLMIEIPQYPLFSQMKVEQILNFNIQNLSPLIIRIRARMVRTFEGKSEVEKIFIQNIGCQFIDLDIIPKVVSEYSKNLSANIVFLLNLFESSYQEADQVALIRKISSMMGYDISISLPVLRQKILHDYHSLEIN